MSALLLVCCCIGGIVIGLPVITVLRACGVSCQWHLVEHSWSRIGIYEGDQPVAALDIYEEATEDNEAELMAEMAARARLIAAAPRMFAVIEAGAKAGDAECLAILEAVNGNA